jgi:hypothetical protein
MALAQVAFEAVEVMLRRSSRLVQS